MIQEETVQVEEVGERPGNAVQLVDDHNIELAAFQIAKQRLQARPVGILAGVAGILAPLRQLPFGMDGPYVAADVVALALQGVVLGPRLLLFRRAADVANGSGLVARSRGTAVTLTLSILKLLSSRQYGFLTLLQHFGQECAPQRQFRNSHHLPILQRPAKHPEFPYPLCQDE